MGPGRGPVDLVGKQDLAEHRTRAEAELRLLLVKEVQTRDVGGQKVRGKLDAGELCVKRPGQGLGQHGLAGARHVLHQHMAAAAQGGEQQLHSLLPADDNRGDVRFKR